MFASTQSARNLLNAAISSADAVSFQTWTDKTTKQSPNRRSVSFQISDAKSAQALAKARQLFAQAGYTESVPKLTVGYHSGCTYIRVIAQMSKG